MGDFASKRGCWAVAFLCEPVQATPLSGDPQRLGVSTRPPELLRSPRPRPTACCEDSGWGFDSSPPLPPPPLRPPDTRGANFQAHCHPGKVLHPGQGVKSATAKSEGALGSARGGRSHYPFPNPLGLSRQSHLAWPGTTRNHQSGPLTFFARPFPSHWAA